MSTDSQFINRFSALLAILVAIAVALVFLARGIAAVTATSDQPVVATAAGTMAATPPVSAPAVAAPAPTVAAPAPAAAAPAAQAVAANGPGQSAAAAGDGAAIYQQVCAVCHGLGIAGAPKMGDSVAWGPRIAKGKATLYDHALHGFNGPNGVMPAKAGRGDLSDASVEAAVDYMVAKSGN